MTTCQVCENGTNVDLITRCGHKIHLKCIIINEFPDQDIYFCPVCKNKIFRSKMLEDVLYNANQQVSTNGSNPNFHIISKFFEEIDSFESIDVLYDGKGQHLRNRNIEIDKNIIETAINFGLDLNSNDPVYRRLLKCICVTDNLHKLNLLIDMGLSLNINEELGKWFVGEALMNESLYVLEKLKELGFDPKTAGDYFPFKITFNLTKWLIENGFGINQNIKNNHLIHIAADQLMLDTVYLLVSKGVHIDLKDSNGSSPFHRSVKQAALHKRIDSDFEDAQKFLEGLIELGADIDIIDKYSSTPLYTAITSKNCHIISLLLSNGANLSNQKIKNLGQTIFIFVEIYRICPFKNIFKIAFDRFQDINERNSEGQTCLHKFLSGRYLQENIKILIKLGVDVRAQDFKGNSPLHYVHANCRYNYETIILLCDYGADIKIKNNEGKLPFTKKEIKYIFS